MTELISRSARCLILGYRSYVTRPGAVSRRPATQVSRSPKRHGSPLSMTTICGRPTSCRRSWELVGRPQIVVIDKGDPWRFGERETCVAGLRDTAPGLVTYDLYPRIRQRAERLISSVMSAVVHDHDGLGYGALSKNRVQCTEQQVPAVSGGNDDSYFGHAY